MQARLKYFFSNLIRGACVAMEQPLLHWGFAVKHIAGFVAGFKKFLGS
jgi:hypothetical protein